MEKANYFIIKIQLITMSFPDYLRGVNSFSVRCYLGNSVKEMLWISGGSRGSVGNAKPADGLPIASKSPPCSLVLQG